MFEFAVPRVETIQRVDVGGHGVGALVDVGVLRFAPFGHPGMAVGVDQPWRDVLAGSVDDGGVLRDLDVGAHRADFAVLDQDRSVLDRPSLGDRVNGSVLDRVHVSGK